MESMPKAVILSAGQGSRLKELTSNKPKGMIEIAGKTIIQRHIEGLNKVGIFDICVVTGFESSKVNSGGYTIIENLDYMNTNMVYSFSLAESFFKNSDVIVLYGDVLVDDSIYPLLVNFDNEIEIVVDTKNWKNYWSARFQDQNSDLEELRIVDGKLIRLGNLYKTNIEDIDGRYVGLIKIPAMKTPLFNNQILSVEKFRNISFTDYLNYLISKNISLIALCIDGGWLELDDMNDYILCNRLINDVTLQRLLNIEIK